MLFLKPGAEMAAAWWSVDEHVTIGIIDPREVHRSYLLYRDGIEQATIKRKEEAQFIVNACNQYEQRLAQVGRPISQYEGPE